MYKYSIFVVFIECGEHYSRAIYIACLSMNRTVIYIEHLHTTNKIYTTFAPIK